MKKTIMIAAALAIAALTACGCSVNTENPSPSVAPDPSVTQSAEPSPSADVPDSSPPTSVDPEIAVSAPDNETQDPDTEAGEKADPVPNLPANTPTASPVVTPAPQVTTKPVVTPAPNATPVVMPTPVATPTPAVTATSVATPTPVVTPEPTPTSTPTPAPVLTPSPDKDYSNPLAIYLQPVSEYDAVKIQEEMIAYAKSIGLVHRDLSIVGNTPNGYNLTYSVGISCATVHSDPYICAANYKNNLKTAIDNAKTIMLSEGNEYLYFDFRMETYRGIVTYMHRIGDLPKTINEDSTVIDTALLEEYGRQYAEAMYGYDGNPNTGFDSNAGYFPPLYERVKTMGDGYEIVRETIEAQYGCDMGVKNSIMEVMNGKIVHGNINIYFKPTDNPEVYLVYCFYGGDDV